MSYLVDRQQSVPNEELHCIVDDAGIAACNWAEIAQKPQQKHYSEQRYTVRRSGVTDAVARLTAVAATLAKHSGAVLFCCAASNDTRLLCLEERSQVK